MSYQAFRNSTGNVDAINRLSDGATVPTWDEQHPITQEFRLWHKSHPEFDTADRPPQAVENKSPKWEQFRAQIMIHSAYLRIATSTRNAMIFDNKLTWLLGEVGGHPAVMGDVINVWNAIATEAKPTLLEIDALNKVAEANNMQFRLNLLGYMVVVSQ